MQLIYHKNMTSNPEKSINRIETEEKNIEKINNLLAEMSRDINHNFLEQIGAPILEENGKISMCTFEIGKGGPYKRSDEEGSIKNDLRYIRRKEREFSGIDNKNTKEFYNKKYKTENEDEILKIKQEENENSNNVLGEKIITILLNKILGQDFLIVRTSQYDDYEHGIDNLIIDRETGEVVGAFDEVLDSLDPDKETQTVDNKKLHKVLIKNKGNKNKIKYGLTFDKDKKLIRQELKDLPVFFLTLHSTDFKQILNEIPDKLSVVGKTDLEIFDKLILSLEEQRQAMLSVSDLSFETKKRLIDFEKSLNKIKASRSRFDKFHDKVA